MPAPHPRADGLTPAQHRAAVAAIVGVHALAGWALMQVEQVREAVAQAAPVFVELLAPSAPPAPPVPPSPAPPRTIRKVAPPAPLVVAAPSPVPAAFVVDQAEVPQLPAPAAPVEVAQLPPSPPAPEPPRNIPASAVQYLEPPLPEYPRASRRAGEAGRVSVRVYIDEAGLPRNVQLSRSSGYPRLDDAAIAAVKKARFRPYTENGRPTAGWASIPLTFDLEA